MLKPSIAELTQNGQSKYSLVIATSKRARQISTEYEKQGVKLKEKSVKLAINDLAQGNIYFNEK